MARLSHNRSLGGSTITMKDSI